jgi:hypothetical protein
MASGTVAGVRHLQKLAKELLAREREFLYGDPKSADQRIASIEKLIIDEEKRLNGNDSEEARRR